MSNKKRADFVLHAPNAKDVFIAGTFNSWDPQARPLRCDRKGNWRTWMSLTPGAYEYRFVVNGEWQEDPHCTEYRPNPYGSHNSVKKV